MASNYNLTPEKKAKLKKEILDEINKETQKPKEKKSNKLVAEPVKPRPLKVAPIKNNSAIEKKIKDDDSKLELKKEIKENIKKPIKKSIPKEKKKTVKKKVVSKKTPVATKKPKEAKKTVAVKKDVVSKPLPVKEDVKSIINDVKKETSLNSSIVDTDNLYKPKKTISKFKLIIGIAIFVVVVALLFLLINIFGIYKLEWDGKTSRAIANTFSLPAGTVDGRQIKLSDYFDDLEKVNLIMAESNNDPEVNREDIKNQLFDRLVSMIVVENELKKYGKEITDEMLDLEIDRLVESIGGEEKMKEEVKNFYKMNVEEFKDRILRPLIAMGLLQQIVIEDESLEVNYAAKDRANEALAIALYDGVDFPSLFLQYVDNPDIVDTGGDMGWFVRGELANELENILFSLPAKTVYDKVIKDQYGYHIFRVDEKLVDDETSKDSIKLSQILITPDVDLYLKSLIDSAMIKKYIK